MDMLNNFIDINSNTEQPVTSNTNQDCQESCYKTSSTVLSLSDESKSPHLDLIEKGGLGDMSERARALLTDQNINRTGGISGTVNNEEGFSGSILDSNGGINGTIVPVIDLNAAVNPVMEPGGNDTLRSVNSDKLDTPCYFVEDDWFLLDGSKKRPGVYYCDKTEGSDKKPPTKTHAWICSPLRVTAISNTEDGKFFGRLLSFRDTLGRLRKWSMPMDLLRGSCEELRGELLAAGVLIDPRNRSLLPNYLQFKTPKEVITAATRTGWSGRWEVIRVSRFNCW